MIKTNIKWPIAKDTDGKYVRIEKAVHGQIYLCPQCADRFVARQGNKKKWHFAHYPGAICSGEGARHDITKHTAASIIQEIDSLPLMCNCFLPTKPYALKFTDVIVEDTINDYRIDVTCKLKDKPIYLEIVDTNPVESGKFHAFHEKIVEINISNLSDDEVFQGDNIKNLVQLSLCQYLSDIAPKHVFVHSWYTTCWKCHQRIKVAKVCYNNCESFEWSQFYPPEVLTVLSKHSIIDLRWSSIVRHKYMANICPKCNRMQGDYFLEEDLMEMLSESRNKEIETEFVKLE